jgi:hypothetical protein
MARTTIRTEDITASEVTTAKMAVDPTNASNLSSGSVPTAQLGNVDTTGLETDIALLGFKVAANGSLAAYNLDDQTVDDFQDASGIDASASTNESRNAADYYIGGTSGAGATSGFTSSGTWTAPTPAPSSIEVLVVAGGGTGGGTDRPAGGGGGGGGILHATVFPVTAGTSYVYTVGAGGTGNGNNGANSVFDTGANTGTLTSIGGGSGSVAHYTAPNNGGSGGGANPSHSAGTSTQTAPSISGVTVAAYGNAGGAGAATADNNNAGGGGGAGAVGTAATTSSGGNGGAGRLFSDFTSYGASGYFGGGGGGSRQAAGSAGSGGSGGGGAGCQGNCTGTAGTANTGGGGGGGTGQDSGNNAGPSNGGSGFVGVHYDAFTIVQDLTLVSNATTADSAPTTGDVVMTYTNGAGTATINTDLKAWISRDNGSTYTQATLTSEGTTGGHTILTAHNVDISSQPSGTSMRYKITTHNQSASKETRIQAVSLGWA